MRYIIVKFKEKSFFNYVKKFCKNFWENLFYIFNDWIWSLLTLKNYPKSRGLHLYVLLSYTISYCRSKIGSRSSSFKNWL